MIADIFKEARRPFQYLSRLSYRKISQSGSHKSCVQNGLIALKFDKRLSGTDRPRLGEILQYNILWDIETVPWTGFCL